MNTMSPEFETPATTETREPASREAVRIGDMARDWWRRNTGLARDVADAVKDEVAMAGDRTRRYVRDEPMRCVLAAAAAGAAITGLLMLFGRRR